LHQTIKPVISNGPWRLRPAPISRNPMGHGQRRAPILVGKAPPDSARADSAAISHRVMALRPDVRLDLDQI
jgi:hypothetical protein